ncbi:hypothetical protein ORM30_24120 [Bacillus cereus]|nr:hypothetical protein [Bacillus cereus]
METFGKVILAGALALGGFTVMNINTPEAHAEGASEFCRYICGPSKTLNDFTIQLHGTEYSFGQNMIAKVTNDRAEDVRYRVTIEKQWASGWGYYDADFRFGSELPAGTNEELYNTTGWGGAISEDGTYRYKVEITNADGPIDTIYTASMTLTGR